MGRIIMKILLVIIVILLVWYFIDKDSLLQKGNDIFNKIKVATQGASEKAFAGSEQQNLELTMPDATINYGMPTKPCNLIPNEAWTTVGCPGVTQ